MPQIDPQQYIVAGGTVGAFAFIIKLMTRYQGSVTSVAFNRIDKLEADLTAERERCDHLEAETRRMSSQLWALEYKLAVLQRTTENNQGDGR